MKKPCPVCKNMIVRRGGKCPACGTPLRLWKKTYIKDYGKAPTTALLDEFMRRTGIRFSYRERMRELAIANTYLDRCNGDQELAMETLITQFTHKDHKWASRSSIAGLFFDLPAARAKAKRKIEARERKVEKEEVAIESVMTLENIFA